MAKDLVLGHGSGEGGSAGDANEAKTASWPCPGECVASLALIDIVEAAPLTRRFPGQVRGSGDLSHQGRGDAFDR
jgi:hypothetical protein